MLYILKRNGIFSLDVKENRVTCEITNSYHINSWNYKYEIRDRNLYITVYNLSFLNPMAKHGWLAVDIDSGFNDFDNIYIDNGTEKEPTLIWSIDDVFSFDKLYNLSVQDNKISFDFDYEHLGYSSTIEDGVLYIDLYENEDGESELKVEIDKGYNDFNEVILSGFENEKIIWSKTE